MENYFFALNSETSPDNYGLKELQQFIKGLDGYLQSLINDKEIFAWAYPNKARSKLKQQAQNVFENHLSFKNNRELKALHETLNEKVLSNAALERIRGHGLTGKQLYFKLSVIEETERLAKERTPHNASDSLLKSAWRWLERLIDAVDVVLDSLVAALDVSGEKVTGCAVMEFKKMLRVLIL